MPGPVPKKPALRARTNRAATVATLTDSRPRRRVPPLPVREGRAWHPLSLAFWRDTWRSPMAAEFVKADIHGLYLLVDLVDRYWTNPSIQLASEIRQQRQAFGLSPIDRRRLEWTVEKAEEAARKRVVPPVREQADDDPRAFLTMV